MTREQRDELNPKIQLHIDEAETNYFRDEHQRRYRMDRRSRNMAFLAAAMILVYLAVVLLPNGLDANNINRSAAWWSNTLMENVKDLARLLGGEPPVYINMIVCRFVIVGLVGAALSVSGAVYQGALKNGLASPTTLGVQTGGALGGTIYVMFFMPSATGVVSYAQIHKARLAMNLFQRYEESFFIMAGSLLAVAFVLAVARLAGKGRISTVALILTGMMFSGAAGGVIGLVRYKFMLTNGYDARAYELRYMMMGTFSRTFTFEHLLLVGIPIAVGITIVMLIRTRLNLLVFGEDEARSMGIRVDFVRNVLLAVVTILTAVVIAFCGMIGFIGFIVPHMARRITGPDFRWLVPASAMTGAITMMGVYYVATAVNYADNINFMTSLIGGGAFLVMLIISRRNSNADWA